MNIPNPESESPDLSAAIYELCPYGAPNTVLPLKRQDFEKLLDLLTRVFTEQPSDFGNLHSIIQLRIAKALPLSLQGTEEFNTLFVRVLDQLHRDPTRRIQQEAVDRIWSMVEKAV